MTSPHAWISVACYLLVGLYLLGAIYGFDDPQPPENEVRIAMIIALAWPAVLAAFLGVWMGQLIRRWHR